MFLSIQPSSISRGAASLPDIDKYGKRNDLITLIQSFEKNETALLLGDQLASCTVLANTVILVSLFSGNFVDNKGDDADLQSDEMADR